MTKLYYFYDEILCQDDLHGTVNPEQDECTDADARCAACGAAAGD